MQYKRAQTINVALPRLLTHLTEELDNMLERLGVSDPDTRHEQAPMLLAQFDTSGSGIVTFEMFASVAEGTLLRIKHTDSANFHNILI